MKVPDLNLLRLTFRLEAQQSVMLPPFLGSTLRGAFGTALKKVFCFVPVEDCGRCWFFEACPYQYLFESPNLIPKEENHQLLKGQKEVPQPYVLIPPNPVRKNSKNNKPLRNGFVNFNEDFPGNHFSRGETLEFSILLVGKATGYWAQVLVAVRLLAEYGLGEMRVPFRLTEAFAHDQIGRTIGVFNIEEPSVSVHGVSPIPLSMLTELRSKSLTDEINGHAEKRLKIEFQTPTRVRIGDEVDPEITFFDLIKKVTERLEFLAFLHSDHKEMLDYRPVLPTATQFSAVNSSLKLYRFEQFSNAQNRKTRREVVFGNIKFDANGIDEFLPFLAAGELLNIGANTSYGFGRYSLDICS